MSEWLTIGEVISKINIGDIAEPDDGNRYEIITKKKDGAIVWKDDMDKCVHLNHAVIKTKWRIIPNFVSYKEAMKAHQEEKKTIIYHHDNELKYTFKHELVTGQFDQLSNDNICLYELLEGKWTIES